MKNINLEYTQKTPKKLPFGTAFLGLVLHNQISNIPESRWYW